MNKFMTALTGTFNKIKFQTIKHSPEILMVTGVVGSVAGIVLACVATYKAKDIVEEYNITKIDITGTDEIKVEDPETHETSMVTYTDDMKKTDLTKVQTRTALLMLKHYSPVVLVEVASIAAIIGSNVIMRKRAIALAAAYSALDVSFKNYRDRVIDRYGEEVDNELRHGIRKKVIEETTVNEKGKEVPTKKEAVSVDAPDEYTRVLDSSNPLWVNNTDYLRMRIDAEENHINDLLRINKHVFLNDALERLCFERTKIGQVVGWTYDKDGDTYIDFDTYIDEDKCVAYLKFNVQGYILNDLKEAGDNDK